MHDRFESLESGEVISVQHDTLVLSGHRTFRVGELNEAIESHLKKAIENWNEENNAWFTDRGLDCEALRFGSKGWQKGRIRLCLEFCPDEPDALSEPVAVNATATSLGATIAPSAVPAPPTPTASHDDRHDRPTAVIAPTATAQTDDRGNFAATTTPAPSETLAETEGSSLPLAGMTAMGAAAVVATIATPIVATATPAPHFTDTTLESEEHLPIDAGAVNSNLDEIAYVFGGADDRGIAAPNGMMELDLTDLGLDFSEHDLDLLSFESPGIPDGADEFINLQDIGRSENSGM
ncbi:KGK domain-containing protein [Chamaesiphon sp. OTE_20_metabat_361]|uniref:KGK domain-containing protein n=1 Tax=Chamaesiphon sp. OTE_20_metabat_361 TaxID=2964689 RepID=UPI00286A30E9|nr:KGK domain-containing protein [Chamaesiphon sp. OTE_20_metabat_361]